MLPLSPLFLFFRFQCGQYHIEESYQIILLSVPSYLLRSLCGQYHMKEAYVITLLSVPS
jgi:hypothetical protein